MHRGSITNGYPTNCASRIESLQTQFACSKIRDTRSTWTISGPTPNASPSTQKPTSAWAPPTAATTAKPWGTEGRASLCSPPEEFVRDFCHGGTETRRTDWDARVLLRTGGCHLARSRAIRVAICIPRRLGSCRFCRFRKKFLEIEFLRDSVVDVV